MPSKRVHHCVSRIGNLIYIVGGFDDFSTCTDDCWSFDLQTGEWRVLPKMQERRAFHQMIAAGNSLFVFGGLTPLGYSDRVEKFDLEKQVWSYCARMPAKRSKHAACLIDFDFKGEKKFLKGGNGEKVEKVGKVGKWQERWKK